MNILTARALSVEEWAAMDEDEPGELVDGRILEEEMPDAIHEVIVCWLVEVWRAWTRVRGGVVLGSDAKFAVAPHRGRKPDLSVYFAGRKPPPRGIIRVPPDLMVEVVSPSPRDERRDRVEKLADYAAFGVRFYWLVDPALRTLEILELGPDRRYTHALGAAEGTIDIVPGCEGLRIALDELWAEIDSLEVGDADRAP